LYNIAWPKCLSSLQIRANGDERIECRDAFTNIHGITSARVRHLAFYAETSPTPPVDQRGRQPNSRAVSHSIKNQISDHIKSFPTVESHYARSGTTKGRKYLSPYLSVAAMHELYLKQYEPEEYKKLRRNEAISPLELLLFILQHQI
jgi:hypothetical protein